MGVRRVSLAWKVVAANTLLAVFAVLMVVALEYRKDRRLLESTIRRELSQAVGAGASLLEGLDLESLAGQADAREEPAVTEKLRALQKTSPAVSSLYILARGPNGEPRVLGSLGTVEQVRFAPDVETSLNLSLDRQVPVQTDVYEDARGQWISAFHPLRNRQGRVVAVLGADFRASDLKLQAREKLHSTLLSASAAALVAVLLSLFIVRNVTRPLKLMAESTAEIASGNLNVSLNLRSGDEIGELGQSFNRMVERLAAAAEERDRLNKQVLAQEKLQQELKLAAEIQQSFLPVVFPFSTSYKTNARSVPAEVVGGDFYDFFELTGDRLGIAIGDVAGRGIGAALFMARLISDFRASALRANGPREALERVNQLLLARSTRGMFVTMTYLVLDPAAGEIRYSSAGHLPALRRSGRTKAVRALDSDQGLPLGISESPGLEEGRVKLERDDALLLVTDGVIEGLCDCHEKFSLEKLIEVFSRASSGHEQYVDAVFEEIAHLSPPRLQQDDMTALSISWQGKPGLGSAV